MTHRFSRLLGGFLLTVGGTTLAIGALPAGAAQPPVGLATATSFAVLAGSEVTNTGPSVINGNLGVSPGTAITGFPPGTVNGTVHSADATAAQAQADTTTAYNDAAGRTPFTAVATELGGRTLLPGVYRNTTLGLTGTLTLDAAGDPEAVFVFQAESTLITASASRVTLINGAQACNVFWQVGSSATLGTTTRFVGTILALTSITAGNGATVEGRLLARNGAVTLNNNTISSPTCAAAVTTTTTTAAPTTTTTAAPTTTTTTAAPVTTPTTAAPGTAPTTAAPVTTPATAAPPTAAAPAPLPTPVPLATPAPTGSGSGQATLPGTGGDSASPTRFPAPRGGTATAAPRQPRSQPGPHGGGTSSLARTGPSGLTPMAVAAVLAILLGAVLVRRSDGSAQ